MVRKTANFDIGAVQKRAKTGIPVTVHRYTGTGSGRTDETRAKLRTRARKPNESAQEAEASEIQRDQDFKHAFL